MKEIKIYIFDWCGTLSNDLLNVYRAAMAVFRELGLKRLSWKNLDKNLKPHTWTFIGSLQRQYQNAG